nr:unnamed protein product [Callosobruchus chinensis]
MLSKKYSTKETGSSANSKVPSYLLSSETLTSDNDKCFLSSVDFNSDFFGLTATGEDQTRALKETFPSNAAFEKKICYPECKPSTSGIAANKSKKPKAPTVPAQTLLDDLEISSSESDPFAGDDEDRNPDFQLPEDSRTKSAIFVGSKKMRNQESDPESTASEEVKKEKSRKRTREPELWKRNKIKRSRNSGRSYVNWKGNLVVERKLKAPCACRLKYSNKITGENRSNIFTGYWEKETIFRNMSFARRKLEAGNETSQRTKKTSRMKSVAEEISRSYNYHLPLDEQKVRVCKTFFLDTLSISAQTVRTVFNKLGSSGVVSEDKRGKFNNPYATTLVRTCKRKQPYIVTELGQENIRDLKDLQEKTSINWEKNDQNERVVWNKMKIVETNFDMPNTILYKYSYEEQEPFQKIIISKKGRKYLDVVVADFYLKQLYSNSIPISKKKYGHLKFLCDKKVIQTAYHDFFKHLPFSENKQTSHNETGDE